MLRSRSMSRDAKFRILGLILLLLLLLVFSPPFARFFTDYLWFQSMDQTGVFVRRILARVELAGSAMVIASAFLLLNWTFVPHWIAPKSRLVREVPRPRTRRTQRTAPPPAQQISISTAPFRIAFAAGAVLAGILIGLGLTDQWPTYLLARNSVPFNAADPIFGLDIGFYVFRLPWYEVLIGRVQILVALVVLGLLVRYLLFDQIRQRGVIAHLSLIGALWLALVGAGRLLSRFLLLKVNEGIVFGAGYTDVHARMPVYTLEAILFFAAAAILIANIFTRQWRLLVGIGIFWFALSLAGPIYPGLVQQLRVEPNEFSLERPYIEHNIALTRSAYGLDTIREQDYPALGTLDATSIEANADVLRNVRLWDYRPLRRTYAQLQEIRLYYTFDDLDVDRYMIDGELTQVMLGARELDVDELAEQAQTWINRHLIFTHGYGIALNSVSGVTAEGLPELLVRDIPPVAMHPELTIAQPGIYFGEKTHAYAIINTAENEFDFPQGDSNVHTRYTGPDGVRLGGPVRRTLFATRFGDAQILLSSALSSDSRILFNRTLQERATAIAPMLWYDDDPYPVIIDGRIIWLLDAYTWTSHYPYSQPIDMPQGPLNYIRNSVKVTIDAYTGETRFYLIEPTEPIAATYARIFPDLFHPVEAMHAGLRAHWRYPETLFLYQSELYATYHMEDPQVFYNREDLWDVPQELVETGQQAMEPYYVTLRLSEDQDPEFLLIRPYVPKERQNMIAWLYARNDGDAYGELGVFKLGKDRLVFGPLQIEGRVDSDPVISQQLSLWDQRGSRVLRGNLLVIPLEDSFLYVEPLYLEAAAGQLPELTRVIVAYADRVAMAATLDDALEQVFGSAGVAATDQAPVTGVDETVDALAVEAWERYQAAQACLENGDWACYGEEQSRLELVLRRMIGERELNGTE
jgi:uncharacterized protein